MCARSQGKQPGARCKLASQLLLPDWLLLEKSNQRWYLRWSRRFHAVGSDAGRAFLRLLPDHPSTSSNPTPKPTRNSTIPTSGKDGDRQAQYRRGHHRPCMQSSALMCVSLLADNLAQLFLALIAVAWHVSTDVIHSRNANAAQLRPLYHPASGAPDPRCPQLPCHNPPSSTRPQHLVPGPPAGPPPLPCSPHLVLGRRSLLR